MELVAIFALILAASIATSFNLRGIGNNTIQPVMQHKDAVPYLRITNGFVAAPEEFRYQVGLEVWHRRRSNICGGSLIRNQWVLTAAHCTFNAELIDVHLGSIWFDHPQTVIQVNRHNIIQHRNYNRTTDEHDISLIRIRAIILSDTIDTVRLPPRITDPPSYITKMAALAGWGRTSNSATTHSPNLQYFLFTIVENEVCGEAFRADVVGRERLCTAAPHGIGSCHGDSGGPLVLLPERVQIGILSFGHLDCEAGFPMVFTRVDSYLDWIYEHIHH